MADAGTVHQDGTSHHHRLEVQHCPRGRLQVLKTELSPQVQHWPRGGLQVIKNGAVHLQFFNLEGICNRVDDDAAPTSEKSCSRGRANSFSSCLDDRGAGVNNANPDFQVLEGRKREDGRRERDVGGERGDCRRERDQEENLPESPRGSPEDPDPARDTGERRSQEASVDTPKCRHVPVGAWLSKTQTRILASQAGS
ncbi:hypothetical protein NDU88_004443 [Pleurodeles waltl]|uniref:Uncharacterized protein n=1 Tax=Pleurodeles waltl TaxID=8319 RepID=A0AAV7QEW5_PLEWA|nr:hypothetical protein NDU88_004443 [Pleurodeles waltl]